eukprot:GILI01019266.1.p1 GENE.GILI01019266.1~~GILI01019266.1.p1  ORF type:complete len:680 (+),score=136.68 GILI01019266.1:59-2041(+)
MTNSPSRSQPTPAFAAAPLPIASLSASSSSEEVEGTGLSAYFTTTLSSDQSSQVRYSGNFGGRGEAEDQATDPTPFTATYLPISSDPVPLDSSTPDDPRTLLYSSAPPSARPALVLNIEPLPYSARTAAPPSPPSPADTVVIDMAAAQEPVQEKAKVPPKKSVSFKFADAESDDEDGVQVDERRRSTKIARSPDVESPVVTTILSSASSDTSNTSTPNSSVAASTPLSTGSSSAASSTPQAISPANSSSGRFPVPNKKERLRLWAKTKKLLEKPFLPRKYLNSQDFKIATCWGASIATQVPVCFWHISDFKVLLHRLMLGLSGGLGENHLARWFRKWKPKGCSCGEPSLFFQRAMGWDTTEHRFVLFYIQLMAKSLMRPSIKNAVIAGTCLSQLYIVFTDATRFWILPAMANSGNWIIIVIGLGASLISAIIVNTLFCIVILRHSITKTPYKALLFYPLYKLACVFIFRTVATFYNVLWYLPFNENKHLIYERKFDCNCKQEGCHINRYTPPFFYYSSRGHMPIGPIDDPSAWSHHLLAQWHRVDKSVSKQIELRAVTNRKLASIPGRKALELINAYRQQKGRARLTRSRSRSKGAFKKTASLSRPDSAALEVARQEKVQEELRQQVEKEEKREEVSEEKKEAGEDKFNKMFSIMDRRKN